MATVVDVVEEASLRMRLVDCALELLEEEGLEGVTLRGIARRAAVSHGAPRWHFPTRAALLSAVAQCGFVELSARVAPVLADRERTALERLDGALRGYVRFATQRTRLFELMFRHDLLREDEPWLRYTSLPLFGALVELVQEAQGGGWRSGSPPEVLAGALWSSVHGLVQLWLWGALPLAVGEHDLDEVLASTLEAWLSEVPRRAE